MENTELLTIVEAFAVTLNSYSDFILLFCSIYDKYEDYNPFQIDFNTLSHESQADSSHKLLVYDSTMMRAMQIDYRRKRDVKNEILVISHLKMKKKKKMSKKLHIFKLELTNIEWVLPIRG